MKLGSWRTAAGLCATPGDVRRRVWLRQTAIGSHVPLRSVHPARRGDSTHRAGPLRARVQRVGRDEAVSRRAADRGVPRARATVRRIERIGPRRPGWRVVCGRPAEHGPRASSRRWQCAARGGLDDDGDGGLRPGRRGSLARDTCEGALACAVGEASVAGVGLGVRGRAVARLALPLAASLGGDATGVGVVGLAPVAGSTEAPRGLASTAANLDGLQGACPPADASQGRRLTAPTGRATSRPSARPHKPTRGGEWSDPPSLFGAAAPGAYRAAARPCGSDSDASPGPFTAPRRPRTCAPHRLPVCGGSGRSATQGARGCLDHE